jgi:L-fuconolactonase
VIVDSHQHFWDPTRADYPWMTDDVAPLRRRFYPEDLEPLLREHGVGGTVQARHSLDETETLLAIAAATPFVLGVVGWVDLAGDVERQLGDLDGALVGIRHQVHDDADPAWLLRTDVQRGLAAVGEAGLVYDLLVRPRELPAAVENPDRCMFGTDWPVCLLASDYGDAIEIVGDDADVLAGTAIRTYGLQVF